MFRFRSRCLLAAALLLAGGASAARAQSSIEIETVVWGFDGKVVPNQFNPMSVLVFNPTADAFDGRLELRKLLYDGVKGATLVEPIFVSPFTRRWVQFYPFVQEDQEEWMISWQPGGGRARQNYRPTHGTPAHVLIESPRSVGRGSKLWAFNEELFPPYVGATAGLASAVLDHEPRWEKPRQQAFLDWLRAGGNLHLLHDSSGEFPRFTGPLAELNAPVETFRLGAGTVFRHPLTRSELDDSFVKQQILSRATIQPVDDSQPVDENDATQQWDYSQQFMFTEINQSFLRGLKGMTRPDHNWVVIHLMSIVYILVVFPGCWLIGRKWRDYRVTLGVLLASIALFSLGFHQIGRRGYGEATAVHTVAFARPLSGGRYDVMSWSNLFVTDGDEYTISNTGSGRMYSTAQKSERVRGFIQNGANAHFTVDIPPFSSREYISRFEATARPISVEVNSWNDAGEKFNATLTAGENFPPAAEMLALHGQQIYRVYAQGEQLTVGAQVGDLSTFLSKNTMTDYRGYNPFFGEEPRPAEQVFRSMLEPLVSRQLGVNTLQQAQTCTLPADRLRLFVYAPLPEGFRTVRLIDGESREFERQEGRVLYCFDLFSPHP